MGEIVESGAVNPLDLLTDEEYNTIPRMLKKGETRTYIDSQGRKVVCSSDNKAVFQAMQNDMCRDQLREEWKDLYEARIGEKKKETK